MLPESWTSAVTSTLVALPSGRSVHCIDIFPRLAPFRSTPLPSNSTFLASSSYLTFASPSKLAWNGPTLAETFPLSEPSSLVPRYSAPGRHAATLGTSWKKLQTVGSGCDTTKFCLISTAILRKSQSKRPGDLTSQTHVC